MAPYCPPEKVQVNCLAEPNWLSWSPQNPHLQAAFPTSSCAPPTPTSLSFGLSRAAPMGGAGRAAAAAHLPFPGAGLPPALPGCVAHGPGLCEHSAPAPGNWEPLPGDLEPLLQPPETQVPRPMMGFLRFLRKSSCQGPGRETPGVTQPCSVQAAPSYPPVHFWNHALPP